ncbi:unnamed protein product [Lymnaea stagnalis]|uniref:G-protein coupled receptors family 2 profile 2 domain-containing protein n=1 Tax=Lymnaea stagnalis TaxID=6523 RepID=A0AAV2HS09_LYMST
MVVQGVSTDPITLRGLILSVATFHVVFLSNSPTHAVRETRPLQHGHPHLQPQHGHPESEPQQGHPDPPRQRYHVSDALPPPGSGEEQVFTSRLLKWHVAYCGNHSLCQERSTPQCYLCAPCQCDFHCHEYGDCCPDVAMATGDDDFPRPFTGNVTNVMSCEDAEFRIPESGHRKSPVTKIAGDSSLIVVGRHASYHFHSYLMVSRCPHAFTRDAGLCEKLGDVWPVMSAENGSNIVYKNYYCARCNSVADIIPWSIKITCDKMKTLTSFQNPREVAKTSFSDQDCDILFEPPAWKEARKCYTDRDVVTACNVTGRWVKRDAFYQRACDSYVTPKQVEGRLYKNVFCYLCNHDHDANTTVHLLTSSCLRQPLVRSEAMVVTLRQSDVITEPSHSPLFNEESYKECGGTGVYDKKEDMCREVTCAVGQHLVSGTCQPIFLRAKGLSYELYFGLRPNKPVDLSGEDELRYHLPAEMEVYLGKVLLQGNYKFQYFAMAFNTTDREGRCSQVSKEIGLYVVLVSRQMVDQRKLQETLLRIRNVNFTIDRRTWRLTFQGYPSESPWHIMHPSRRLVPPALSTCVIIVSNDLLQQRREGIIRVGTTTPDPNLPQDPAPVHIRISNLLTCPQVRLFPHEYSVAGPDGVLAFHLGAMNSDLHLNRYLVDLDGNVTVCLDDFLVKLTRDTGQRTTVENILVAVILPVSLLCLLACFTVFLAFSELRALSGRNNMLFTACLFCSQGALLLGYVVDDTSRWCVAFGVLSHYFCLCFFCALVICSYHMYAKFTTMHLSANETKEGRRLLVYCCITFSVPLAVILLVIIVHVTTHLPEVVVGYGGGAICIMSKVTAVWVSLFLPLGISLTITTILYIITCLSLRHNKDVETNATEERHVKFYFRSSLLTSITWTIGIVAIVTSCAYTRIAFIVMQSLLGLYVFVTLVLTERVTRLLTGCCCGSRRPPRGRTSLNLKMASRSECPARNPCIVATGFRKRDTNVPVQQYDGANESIPAQLYEDTTDSSPVQLYSVTNESAIRMISESNDIVETGT